MDDFDLERNLEDAGIDAFEFSLMDEGERREALEEAFLDPDKYENIEFDSAFDAWSSLQDAGISLSDLDSMDEDERRIALEEAGLDPADYGLSSANASVSDTFQPSMAVQPKPLREESNPRPTIYRYCNVIFSGSSQEYAYRTEDRSIKAGNSVIVPAGLENKPTLVTVVSVGDYVESTVPYPLDKTKFILRKATEANVTAQKTRVFVDKAAAPGVAVERANDSKSTEKEETSSEQAQEKFKRQRKTLLTVIAVLIVVVVVLLGIVFSNLTAIKENYRSWQDEQAQKQHEAAMQSFLAAAAAYESDLVDDIYAEFDSTYLHRGLKEFTEELSVRIESEVIEGGNSGVWKETVYLDITANPSFEDNSDSLKAIHLYDYSIAALNKTHWNNQFYLPTRLRTMLSDNGYSRSVVCHVTITTEDNVYEYDRGDGVRASLDFYYLNGERHDVVVETTPTPRPTATPKPTATPRPASTPKRTTSTPKPDNDDPYNARDYSHPDDFYYDYYDDFWDYEDAEDYWEEWND